MRKVFTVAVREYKAAVLTKAFLIGLAMMPILIGGSLVIQWVFKDMKSLKPKTVFVVDRTPKAKMFPLLESAAKHRNKELINDKEGKQKDPEYLFIKIDPEPDVLKQRYELGQRVRKEEAFAFIDIGAKVFEKPAIEGKVTIESYIAELSANMGDFAKEKDDSGKAPAAKLPEERTIRYYSNSPTHTDLHKWINTTANRVIQTQRAVTEGLLEIAKLAMVMIPAPTTIRELPRINPFTGEIQDGKEVNIVLSLIVPFAIVMLMFTVIMVGATPLMQGVVEEKMQRIAEVLLASTRPFQLMLGKLLGGVGVSLTLGTVYMAGGLIAAWQYGFTDYLSLNLVFWFLVYLILAVLMFGSLFIAVGAACTEIKETQNLVMPVMLLAMVPLFFLMKIIQEPDGALARGISYFPFATPSVMVARVAIPPGAATWEPILGVVIVLLTTLLCVWIAGRIFRVGLLMQGKAASLGEIARWVWKG